MTLPLNGLISLYCCCLLKPESHKTIAKLYGGTHIPEVKSTPTMLTYFDQQFKEKGAVLHAKIAQNPTTRQYLALRAIFLGCFYKRGSCSNTQLVFSVLFFPFLQLLTFAVYAVSMGTRASAERMSPGLLILLLLCGTPLLTCLLTLSCAVRSCQISGAEVGKSSKLKTSASAPVSIPVRPT